MDQQLQDDLKLVAEFDTDAQWENLIKKNPDVDFLQSIKYGLHQYRTMKYHTSWNWQIPVWAKLFNEGSAAKWDYNDYNMCIANNKPAEGFKIIVSIIKRIK